MRRLVLLLVVLGLCGVGLAACDDPGARTPFTDSRIPPGLPQRALPPEGWAWGLLQIGSAPPVRYGVAAPGVVPRGQVLILPDYGEPAESWFETASHLISRGYGVWVLEGVGQGGSGRFTLPRDVGHVRDFQTDLAALQAMRAVMGHRPAVVIARGAAAPLLMTALRGGLAAQGAILSSPVLSPVLQGPYPDALAQAAPWIADADLGRIRALGAAHWRRQDPAPAGRTGVIGLWQAANPDLRMAGPSYGWIAAFQDETDALKAGGLGAVHAPVLILHPGAQPSADAAALCRRLARCTLKAVPAGRASLNLESDAAFQQWSEAVDAFVQTTKPPEACCATAAAQ